MKKTGFSLYLYQVVFWHPILDGTDNGHLRLRKEEALVLLETVLTDNDRGHIVTYNVLSFPPVPLHRNGQRVLAVVFVRVQVLAAHGVALVLGKLGGGRAGGSAACSCPHGDSAPSQRCSSQGSVLKMKRTVLLEIQSAVLSNIKKKQI